ncbi:CFEM domain-containing protein [Aspergillus clavatus NRRL 1]|uniref:CFEM domain protein n=1 Tax=Aspergillus clavatus (strain ATCC 1007 / CBS 513.65 / DSM 816 / NCTC 3887 / NRRL 1 / QM 1276 / 107) TaxID=344612 RepID=A1CLL1_ASPCL|nr:CFEM domain protein [Aspergillus clavatus NRRL 1]EAW10035.1 CFEM domain protein [Aspergillus clavatus NRRL 1]
MTLSSCYPSQFYYSAVGTTTLPPYVQLVCPQDWETYNVTDTYIICCPGGYGVYAPNYQDTARPGLGAVCTSSIWPNVLMDTTSYDSTGSATVIPTVAGDDGVLVFATAFDGTKATSVGSSTSSSSPISLSSHTTSTIPATTSTIPVTPVVTTTPIPSTTGTATLTAISQLPTCGQTCFSNMLAKYDDLGFPASASASPTTISDLPTCGQTCFNNMLAQYSFLGCSNEDASCLCENINFYYGIRDCSNAACGTDVATTVLAFESSYCASATATATHKYVLTSCV